MQTYSVEMTDTFAGAANYAWIRRATVQVPEGAGRRMIVRRAKAALGITGLPCKTEDWFDGGYRLTPRDGSCVVVFIF